MSADEIKKTPDVEAAAEPETTEVEAAETTEAEAPKKKPAAKKPAAKKPAAAKADDAAADEKAADEKAPAKKPAVKKPAAKDDAADEKAAKPAAKKATAKKPAAKATKAEPKKSARKAAPAAEKPAPKAERPPKPAPAAKAEARKGAAGVATFVDAAGKEVETRKLADGRFGVAADVNTLHLVVRAEQAARRSGSASTKTRGEVAGSTAKLYRQKGTGRARAGSVKSPIRTGGGVVFGPRPRSYDIKVNKKVARKALAMALSDRAANGRVFVAAGLAMAEPSTRTVEEFLVNLDCAAPVLVVTHDEPVVTKSVRNLPYAEASEVAALSTEQVLRARSLVLTEKAFAALNEA